MCGGKTVENLKIHGRGPVDPLWMDGDPVVNEL